MVDDGATDETVASIVSVFAAHPASMRSPGSRDDAEVTEDVDVALAILLTGGTIRLSGQVKAGIDVVRSKRPSKQAEYLHSDQCTRRKYERLREQRRQTAN